MRRGSAIGATILLVVLGLSGAALARERGARGLSMRTLQLPPPSGAASSPGSAAIGDPAVVWDQRPLATDQKGDRAYLAPSTVIASPVLGGVGGLSVFTLDILSGRTLRRTDVSTPVSAVIPDPPAGRVLLLQPWSRALGVLDAATGRLLSPIALGYRPGAVAIDARSGRGYAAGLDARLDPTLSIVDVRGGRSLRTVALGIGRPVWIVVNARSGRVFVGLVVATPGGGSVMRVAMLDATTGQTLHVVRLPGSAVAALDAGRARLYLMGARWVRVLDARTGRPLRTITLGPVSPRGGGGRRPPDPTTPPDGSIAVDPESGRVAVGRPDGTHVALLDDRDVARTLSLPGGVVTVAAGAGRVVLQLYGGRVAVLNARTGEEMQTIVAPGGTDAVIAVNRVFLLDQEPARVTPPDPWGWVPAGVRARLPGVPHRPGPYTSSGSLTVIDLPAQ